MKVAIIAVVLAAVTAAAGYWGLSFVETGGEWYGVFGLTFMFALLATDSLVLGSIAHLALCYGVVFLIAKAVGRRRQEAR